jgi:hypothetical protein
MGRALAAVGAALVICLGIFGGVVYLTAEEDTVAVDAVLAERITRAVAMAEQRGEDVDLARLAPFAWDRVVIYPPGTPKHLVDAEVGFDFKGDLQYTAESSEVFVFVDNGQLARFADYRGRRSFEGLDRPIDQLPRERAVFVVRDGVARPRPAG